MSILSFGGGSWASDVKRIALTHLDGLGLVGLALGLHRIVVTLLVHGDDGLKK